MSDKVNGMMVFYIDVGQLPPYKAEAFLARIAEKNKDLKEKLNKNGIEAIWIPLRPNSGTRVEYHPISEDAIKFQAKLYNVELTDILADIDNSN